jgi:hypothetical protein
VSGNVSVRIAGLNIVGILKIMGKHLETLIIPGVATPLSKKIVHAEEDMRGKKVLGNINLEHSIQQALLLRPGGNVSQLVRSILKR